MIFSLTLQSFLRFSLFSLSLPLVLVVMFFCLLLFLKALWANNWVATIWIECPWVPCHDVILDRNSCIALPILVHCGMSSMPRCHAAQSKLSAWSMAMNLCCCSDSAAFFRGDTFICQDWTLQVFVFLLSERFLEQFEHFPLHFGHYPWHLLPHCRYTFALLHYNVWNSLSCRATTGPLSTRNFPSCFMGPLQSKRLEWWANCQSSLWLFWRYKIWLIPP